MEPFEPEGLDYYSKYTKDYTKEELELINQLLEDFGPPIPIEEEKPPEEEVAPKEEKKEEEVEEEKEGEEYEEEEYYPEEEYGIEEEEEEEKPYIPTDFIAKMGEGEEPEKEKEDISEIFPEVSEGEEEKPLEEEEKEEAKEEADRLLSDEDIAKVLEGEEELAEGEGEVGISDEDLSALLGGEEEGKEEEKVEGKEKEEGEGEEVAFKELDISSLDRISEEELAKEEEKKEEVKEEAKEEGEAKEEEIGISDEDLSLFLEEEGKEEKVEEEEKEVKEGEEKKEEPEHIGIEPDISVEDEFAELKKEAESVVEPSLPSVEEKKVEEKKEEVAPPPPKVEEKLEPKRETIFVSDEDAKAIKEYIDTLDEPLKSAVKRVIINELLPAEYLKKFLELLLTKPKPKVVKNFLEIYTGRSVESLLKPIKRARKEVVSKPRYTVEGRIRQKKLESIVFFAGISVFLGLFIGITSFYVYKKYIQAPRLIREGILLIIRDRYPTKKSEDYRQAERLFSQAVSMFNRSNVDFYIDYGNAYMQSWLNHRVKIARRLALLKLRSAVRKADSDSEIIKSRVSLAHFFAKSKEWDKALKEYKSILRVSPKNKLVLDGIGSLYFEKGDYNKALKWYKRLLEVDKDDILSKSRLIDTYISLDKLKYVLEMHYKLSEDDDLHNLPNSTLIRMANYYLSKKRVKARYNLQNFLENIKPSHPDNLLPEAYQVLQILLRKDKNSPEIRYQMARYYYITNNFLLAIRELERAIKLGEDEASFFRIYNLLGKMYYVEGNLQGAYSSFKKAVSLLDKMSIRERLSFSPLSGEPYFFLANIFYYSIGNNSEKEKMESYLIAQRLYQKAKSLYFLDKNGELLYNLGRIYYLQKDYKSALIEWVSLYKNMPDNPHLSLGIGNANLYLRNLPSAYSEYRKIISRYERIANSIRKVYPENEFHYEVFSLLSRSYNNIGVVYEMEGDKEKALSSYWKAVDYARRIGVENVVARINLERAFRRGFSEKPLIYADIPQKVFYRKSLFR